MLCLDFPYYNGVTVNGLRYVQYLRMKIKFSLLAFLYLHPSLGFAAKGAALPWFKQSPSLWLLLLLLFVGLIYGLIKWRTRYLEQNILTLQTEVEKRKAELITLTEVLEELNSTLDVPSIASRLQKLLAASLNAHVFALAIVDEQQHKLHFRNVIENNLPLDAFDVDLNNDEHVAIVCIKQNIPVIMDRSKDSVKYLGKPSKVMAGENMESVMYYPLSSHDGRVIGCITVQAPEQYAYSDSDKKMMAIMASSTAIALDNAQTYAALEKVSLTDYLTGLPNRRAFEETAKTVVGRAKRNLAPFALVMADIDHFKHFNDQYGHEAGDYVLQQVSHLMKQAIREQDSLCRWGGEEFIFLLPETDLTGARTLAEKLRKTIAQTPLHFKQSRFEVTVTFGVTVCPPTEPLHDSIQRADNLLYQGKAAGRNQVVGG